MSSDFDLDWFVAQMGALNGIRGSAGLAQREALVWATWWEAMRRKGNDFETFKAAMLEQIGKHIERFS